MSFLLAVSLLPLTAVTARADLFGDLVKIAEQAASVALNSAEAAIDQATKPAADPDGDDPKPVQPGDEPKQPGADQTPDEAAADAKAQQDFLKANAKKVNDVVSGLVDDILKTNAKLLDAIESRKPGDVVGAVFGLVNSVLTRTMKLVPPPKLDRKVSPEERDASMQAPNITVVNPGNFTGDLVYFVNGVNTTKEAALKEAGALASRIQRPVGLIYNVTNGIATDLTEAIYDRTWPFVVPVVGQLIQANSTTRQVAHLIYHADKPISIVSHSQGCIIVRNALWMANTYTDGKAKDRVTWIATGLPLRDEEVCPKPDRYRGLVKPDNTVSHLIGLRFKPEKLGEDAFEAHDFVKAYVNEINPDDVR